MYRRVLFFEWTIRVFNISSYIVVR